MPALLYRMKICESYTLEELDGIFNYLRSKIQINDGPSQFQAAAVYHFPEVFIEFKDQYVASILHEICLFYENLQAYDSINAYVGNTDVKPLCRLFQTGKYKSGLNVSEPK